MVEILAYADEQGRITPSTLRHAPLYAPRRTPMALGIALALADAAGRVYAVWDGSKHPRDEEGKWITKSVPGADGTVPAEPGTTPIPEGHVRLYHQTEEQSLLAIAKSGLKLEYAKGLEGPKAVYAGETPFYGAADSRPTLEFFVPKNKWSSPFVLQDVFPQNMIAIHLPWHSKARYLENNPGSLKQALAGEFDSLTSDYAPAVAYVKQKYGVKKTFSTYAISRPLYVCRAVENADEIIAWAKSQGIETTLPPEEMHVTVCYSRDAVDWQTFTHMNDTFELPASGVRELAIDDESKSDFPNRIIWQEDDLEVIKDYTDDGKWITVKGRHVLIKDGEDVGDAIKRSDDRKRLDTARDLKGVDASRALSETFKYPPPELTVEQRAALRTYVEDGAHINYALRNNPDITSSAISRSVTGTDGVFQNVPATVTDMVVFRGVQKTVAATLGLDVGAVVKDAGFVSTTLSHKVAGEFAESFNAKTNLWDMATVLEIKVPAGSKVLSIPSLHIAGTIYSDREAEVLLPRGSKFRITSVKGNRVQAELLPQGQYAEYEVNYADTTLTRLGDKGAVVLKFESPQLAERHNYFRELGASWDYEEYTPHITLSYTVPDGFDLATVQPYIGRIVLGPEEFEELDTDWGDKVKEHAQDDEGNEGVWRTVRGRKIFIRDGEDFDAALARSLGKGKLVSGTDKKKRTSGTLFEDDPDGWAKKPGVFIGYRSGSVDKDSGYVFISNNQRGAESYEDYDSGVAARKFEIKNPLIIESREKAYEALTGESTLEISKRASDAAYRASMVITKVQEKIKKFGPRAEFAEELKKAQIKFDKANTWQTRHEQKIGRDAQKKGHDAVIVLNPDTPFMKREVWLLKPKEQIRSFEQKESTSSAITIDYAQIKNDLDAMEGKFRDELRELLTQSRNALMATVRRRGAQLEDVGRTLELPYAKAIENAIAEALQRAMDRGGADARKEILPLVKEHAITFTPKAAIKWLKAKIFWVSDVLSTGLLSDIRLILINGLKTGKLNDEIVTDIANAYVPYLGDPKAVKTPGAALPTAARLETVVRTNLTEAYSKGRLSEYIKPKILPFLDGIKYSAILDSRTCFVSGTLVNLARGGYKAIDKLVLGDQVVSGAGIVRRVVGTKKKVAYNLVLIETDEGDSIVCTPTHPFWIRTEEGYQWQEAWSLRQGGECGTRDMRGLSSEVHSLGDTPRVFCSASLQNLLGEAPIQEAQGPVRFQSRTSGQAKFNLQGYMEEAFKESEKTNISCTESGCCELASCESGMEQETPFQGAVVEGFFRTDNAKRGGQEIRSHQARSVLVEKNVRSTQYRPERVLDEIPCFAPEFIHDQTIQTPETSWRFIKGTKNRVVYSGDCLCSRFSMAEETPSCGVRRTILARSYEDEGQESGQADRSFRLEDTSGSRDRAREESSLSKGHNQRKADCSVMPIPTGFCKISSVRIFPACAWVYDIEVEADHSYLVGQQGLIAHNTQVCNFLHGKVFKPTDPALDGLVPPNHFNALAEGTLILTQRGQVPIEEVISGDSVFTHRGRWRPVYATMRKEAGQIIRLQVSTGRVLWVTEEHPLLMSGGWKAVRDLKVGDQLFELCEQGQRFEGVPASSPQHFPSLFDEGSVAYELTSYSCKTVIDTAVQFNHYPFFDECKISNVAADAVLEDVVGFTLVKDTNEDFLMSSGVCAPSLSGKFVPLFENSFHSDGVVSFHQGTNLGSFNSVSPVSSARTVCDRFRESIGDAGLGLFGARFDFVDTAIFKKMVDTDLYLSSEATQGSPLFPVGASDKFSEFLPVRQIHINSPKWVCPTIIMQEGRKYKGLVYNLAVEEDESYHAENLVTHNCRSLIVPVVMGEKIPDMAWITKAEIEQARGLADVKFLEQGDLQEYDQDDEGHEGKWVTVKGRAIFIRKDEDMESALTRSLLKKGSERPKADEEDKTLAGLLAGNASRLKGEQKKKGLFGRLFTEDEKRKPRPRIVPRTVKK